MEPLAMPNNKADILVLVLQDGKVPFVLKTLMIVPKNLVFLVSTVLIWSMILVAIVQVGLEAKDAKKSLIFVQQLDVSMEHV